MNTKTKKEQCIYRKKGCNKSTKTCKRESCTYAKYFDYLTDNFRKK